MDHTLECPPDRPSLRSFRQVLGEFWRNVAGGIARRSQPTRIDPERWSNAMLRDIGLGDCGRDNRQTPMDWRLR